MPPSLSLIPSSNMMCAVRRRGKLEISRSEQGSIGARDMLPWTWLWAGQRGLYKVLRDTLQAPSTMYIHYDLEVTAVLIHDIWDTQK